MSDHFFHLHAGSYVVDPYDQVTAAPISLQNATYSFSPFMSPALSPSSPFATSFPDIATLPLAEPSLQLSLLPSLPPPAVNSTLPSPSAQHTQPVSSDHTTALLPSGVEDYTTAPTNSFSRQNAITGYNSLLLSPATPAAVSAAAPLDIISPHENFPPTTTSVHSSHISPLGQAPYPPIHTLSSATAGESLDFQAAAAVPSSSNSSGGSAATGSIPSPQSSISMHAQYSSASVSTVTSSSSSYSPYHSVGVSSSSSSSSTSLPSVVTQADGTSRPFNMEAYNILAALSEQQRANAQGYLDYRQDKNVVKNLLSPRDTETVMNRTTDGLVKIGRDSINFMRFIVHELTAVIATESIDRALYQANSSNDVQAVQEKQQQQQRQHPQQQLPMSKEPSQLTGDHVVDSFRALGVGEQLSNIVEHRLAFYRLTHPHKKSARRKAMAAASAAAAASTYGSHFSAQYLQRQQLQQQQQQQLHLEDDAGEDDDDDDDSYDDDDEDDESRSFQQQQAAAQQQATAQQPSLSSNVVASKSLAIQPLATQSTLQQDALKAPPTVTTPLPVSSVHSQLPSIVSNQYIPSTSNLVAFSPPEQQQHAQLQHTQQQQQQQQSSVESSVVDTPSNGIILPPSSSCITAPTCTPYQLPMLTTSTACQYPVTLNSSPSPCTQGNHVSSPCAITCTSSCVTECPSVCCDSINRGCSTDSSPVHSSKLGPVQLPSHLNCIEYTPQCNLLLPTTLHSTVSQDICSAFHHQSQQPRISNFSVDAVNHNANHNAVVPDHLMNVAMLPNDPDPIPLTIGMLSQQVSESLGYPPATFSTRFSQAPSSSMYPLHAQSGRQVMSYQCGTTPSSANPFVQLSHLRSE